MIVVLIHWKIDPNPELERSFLNYWKRETTIQNRRGLVGEFLSTVGEKDTYPYITWDLSVESSTKFKTYLTVGIWEDGEAFGDQIGQYFNDEKPMKDFEVFRRVRTVVEPTCWRIGNSSLPLTDSDGVL